MMKEVKRIFHSFGCTLKNGFQLLPTLGATEFSDLAALAHALVRADQ